MPDAAHHLQRILREEARLRAGSDVEWLRRHLDIHQLPVALRHPAEQLANNRAEKFYKVVTPTEKKLLEEVLERSLGVSRRKPAPRKVVKKTAAAPRKQAPKKTERPNKSYF